MPGTLDLPVVEWRPA